MRSSKRILAHWCAFAPCRAEAIGGVMADVAKEDAVSEPQSPRTGTIELLQVLSLLAVPIAVLLYKAGYPYSASLAAMVFAVLALVPFWLAKPPQYVEWDKGFKITPER